MDTLAVLTTLLAGASVVMIALGARQLVLDDQNRITSRIRRSGRAGMTGRRLGPDVSYRDRARNSKLFSGLDARVQSYGWAQKARIDLRRAEVHLHLSEYYGARIVLGLVVAALVVLVWGEILAYFVGIGLGLVAWYIPAVLVRRRIDRRMRRLEDQLDAALTSIASAIRSGFSFLQAVQMTVSQLEWPLRDELEAVLEETNLGVSIEDALRNMAERLKNYEVDIVVNAVMVHRAVGGSLSEVLDSVAKTIRDRRELKGHLMALTAQQRLSAIFVASVPVFMAGFLSVTSWQFMHPLFTTTLGNVLIAFGVVFDVLGFLVMRRLTRIDF